MQHDDLSSLYNLLKTDGERIVQSRSKLSLSTSLLQKVNAKLASLMPYGIICSYAEMERNIFEAVDLQMLYNVVEHTLALKIFNDCNSLEEAANQSLIDLHFFRNLKLLEVQRLSIHLLKGLKSLRSQLKFLTCMRSVQTLKDVFELCGADKTQGYVWSELKEAVFSHNHLQALDNSMEFVPLLESLDLSYNQIKQIENLSFLLNLKHLNLSNNNIEVLPKFTSCNLQTLILKNNYIEELTNVECLINLELFDVSNNCLLCADTLQSLNHLKLLKKLNLNGNPLSYQKNYRVVVCCYLSIVSNDFCLDGRCLNAAELRVVDSMPKLEVAMESSGSYLSISDATVILADVGRELPSNGSFHSCVTANTVIEAVRRYDPTSDMEISQTSVETRNEQLNTRQMDTIRALEGGMHDSGIVAGHPRPASPIDSIGSATSLHDEEYLQIKNMKRHSESDISILSNPSQSSIEVLSDQLQGNNKCVQQSTIVSTNLSDMCPDEELKKVGEEMHCSL